jgi:RNA polymerase sigma-70 factor (ECF subfamily)
MNVTEDHRLREAFRELSRGRMEALEVIWRECAERLHNYAFALTADDDAADDILSEVLVRVARRGWRLRFVRDPRAYLFAAVRNAVRSRARRKPTEALAVARASRDAPDPQALAVRQAVLDLPGEQREVLVLHLWGGRTFEEIGFAVGTSPNTAASRYRYALSKLRQALGGEDDG